MRQPPYKNVLQHEILSADEERALLTRYAAVHAKHGADHAEAIAIRNRMVLANMRLAAKWAQHKKGLSFEDRVAYAVEGLMIAVEKYDAERGFRFTTYASWWVRAAIQRAIINFDPEVRVPVHRVDGAKHRELDGVTLVGRQPLSFDAPISADNDNTLHSVLSDIDAEHVEDRFEHAQQKRWLRRRVLDRLDRREREILECHYGLRDDEEQTLEQIAERLDLTRERVRQIEAEALAKLRRRATAPSTRTTKAGGNHG